MTTNIPYIICVVSCDVRIGETVLVARYPAPRLASGGARPRLPLSSSNLSPHHTLANPRHFPPTRVSRKGTQKVSLMTLGCSSCYPCYKTLRVQGYPPCDLFLIHFSTKALQFTSRAITAHLPGQL